MTQIELIIDSIVAEGREKRCVLPDTVRRQLKHRDISLKTPRSRRFLAALRNIRHNPHELMHYIFRIPVLGYTLNLLSYTLRLPTQLRKLREEIAALHQHLADLEARMTKMTTAEIETLSIKVRQMESRIQALSAKDRD